MNKITTHFILLFFLFFLSGINLIRAQGVNEFTFDHLTIEEGLSQSTVFAITKDADGFMWFGTRDGLNRYDSRTLKIYNHNGKDRRSLSGSSVHCLLVDSQKQLWVGTNEGLNIYHAATDDFTRSKLNPDSHDGLHNNHVAAILEDKKGAIWIGTHGGLSKVISKEPLQFQHFKHNDSDPASLLNDEIRALYTDRQGFLWVGTTKGVCKVIEAAPGKYTFKNYPLYSTHIQGKSWINCITEDDRGNLLIGTEQNGIKQLDLKTGIMSSFEFKNNTGRAIETVRVMQRDGHTLLIGTLEGLYIYNLHDDTLQLYKNDPDDNLSLSDNSIRSIYKDQWGSYWIGTFYGGVNYYSPLARQFVKINLTDQRNQKVYKIAGAMLTDHHRNLWISTDGNGLFCINNKGETVKQFVHQANNSNSLSHNKIKCLLLDDDKGLWIGTINGLNYYDFKSGKFERYFHDANDPYSLPDDRIYDLKKDSQGNMWIASYRGGLCLLNKKTRRFEKFTYSSSDPASLSSDGITYIYEDSGNNLWVGTVSGLNKKPKGLNTFERFVNSDNQNNMYVLCMYEDKQKRLWVGTRDTGLKLKIKGSNEFKNFTTDNGLAGNSVNGILEDSRGVLWVSTEKGLSRVDPSTFAIKNYNKNDGLICNEFNFNSFHKDSDGFMYFGGYNGIVKFHPDSIRENTAVPLLTFTKLKVFNKEVYIDSSANSILRQSLTKTSNLEFAYAQNVFSVEFASLNFIHPSKNKYAYKLSGFEDQWNYVNEPVATYMNLSPGTYTLLAKGSNNDGTWNEEPIQLTITILPPIWKTWWAYCIYCMIILGLVYALLLFNKIRWKLTHDLKIEQLEKEQQEKLHKAKLNFFTNIAHEIRTPLTLIVSPLELATMPGVSETFLQKQLQIVKSNTGRLTRLINQLLDFQKQESGNLKLKRTAGNIVQLLKEIAFSFSEYANARNIQLDFKSDRDTIQLNYDRDELEKVFYNLLYNAFKFTPGGGKVSVIVSVTGGKYSQDGKEYVNIILEDNGIGISEADLPKIFNRFYQVENTGIRESGFGIGLALTKGIIDLHGGTIAVDSREAMLGQSGYTRFSITLPIEHHAFVEEPLTHHQPIAIADTVDRSFLPYHVSEEPEKQKHDHRYSILLVEDNEEIRNCLKNIVSPYYSILEAGDGAEALALANRHLPDIVISDIAMPLMDGLDFTRQLKSDERTHHIPVILVTARGAAEHHIEGIDTGADDYITKPFHSQMLLLKIRNLLAMRERLKGKYQKLVTLEPRHEEVEDPDHKFLQRLMNLLDANMNDPEFNVAKLVTEIGMSRPVLFRKVKMLTGLSVIDLIRSTRLKKAEMLLRQKKMTISEVAFTVGFNDPKYFSKSFHAQFGTTPSKYMESIE
jgi:ligand-binding sensor domain-containing protein/signal transduction histidine kinase/DNA-binding response OmpR family regulator